MILLRQIMLSVKKILFAKCFLIFTTSVFAQNIYTYEHNDGSLVITDKKQNNSALKNLKVTYFPDSNIHSYTNWGGSNKNVATKFRQNVDLYAPFIKASAQKHGVDERLVKAVIHTESGFNPFARSPVGAQGLMQLMPATARRFNVSNSYDPEQNIQGGTKYLAWLLKRFKGDRSLALAAYNAGEGNVDKHGGIPPFRETKDYVRRVLARYNGVYSGSITQVSNLSIAESKEPPSSKETPILKLSPSKFGDNFATTY